MLPLPCVIGRIRARLHCVPVISIEEFIVQPEQIGIKSIKQELRGQKNDHCHRQQI
jgi:hypothetical protein